MPQLSAHHSKTITKLLLMGDSGAGKTGALASLADAGYKLFILDLDNGIDVLANYLTSEKSPYDKACAANVRYVTLTDPMRSLNGMMFAKSAKAWLKLGNMLDRWKDGDEDLGVPSEFGDKSIVVIDSLTFAAQIALNYHLSINGALGKVRTSNEGRRDIGAVQTMLENLLRLLYSDEFKCNVIVTSHITYTNDDGTTPNPDDNKQVIGFPSAIGRSLSPRIPRYFNTMVNARVIGTGPSAKHQILTHSNGIIAGKSSAPLKLKSSYPLETGLAEIFKALRE